MRALLRCLKSYRSVWRVCLPLLWVTFLSPAIVLTMPLVQRELIDQVIVAQRLELLVPTMALYSGLWLAMTGIHIINGLLRTYVNERLIQHFRQQLFAHCDALALAF